MRENEIFIIGLGNPGKDFLNTRHNIGFSLLQLLSEKYNSKFTFTNKLKSFSSEFKINNCTYRLFMPNTFMNNSGDAVRAIIDWYKIDLEKIYIIVDDIDLPLGKIRFRTKGSSGGHNGLKSIIEKLQTQNFNRIRVGIGAPKTFQETRKSKTISHVLGKISEKEKLILDKVYTHIIKSLELLNVKKADYVMSELNSFK